MAKLKMKKIEILAPNERSKEILDLLQLRSAVEITECEKNDSLYSPSTRQTASQLEKYLSSANESLGVLDSYCPEKKNLLAAFAGKSEMPLSEYEKRADKASAILAQCIDILSAKKNIDQSKTDIARIKALMTGLEGWLPLEVPMQFGETGQTKVFIGTLPAAYTADELETRLYDACGGEEKISCKIISSEKTLSRAVICAHRSCSDTVFAALRELGFAYPADPTKHPPKVRYERYKCDIAKLEKQITESETLIKSKCDIREDIKFLCDYLSIRRSKYDALEKLGMSSSIVVINGWIAEDNTASLTNELEEKFGAAVSVTDPGEDEEPPVLLKNNSFAAGVESVTEMYSVPGKNDIDPNPVMSFFYYAFFGIMLSDAGYGLIMVLAMLIAKFKLKPSGNMKRTIDMYFYCGVSTLIWGALFGSWFGDIIPVVSEQFFGKKLPSLAIWFEPVNDPMKLMMYSFLFGIIHLFVGLGVRFYELWKHGEKLAAVCDVIPIYLLVTGIVPLAGGIIIDFDPTLKTIGKYLALAGAVLVVLTSGRSAKNIIGKLGGGLYGLYNAGSGYLGDVLSYSRLLALGLCTGVIGSVVNILGTIPENKIVKLLLLIPVFLFGHTVNLVINLIGAYVHTNRLQYVEFFSKFYEGGGRSFTPLSTQTKYFTIKED